MPHTGAQTAHTSSLNIHVITVSCKRKSSSRHTTPRNYPPDPEVELTQTTQFPSPGTKSWSAAGLCRDILLGLRTIHVTRKRDLVVHILSTPLLLKLPHKRQDLAPKLLNLLLVM